MTNKEILMPQDRPKLGHWIPLSFQHVFAMFGATILVPIITGLNPAIALFTAGTGTIIFILCTGAKVPAFLGSSFSFIAPLLVVTASFGLSYALGGAMVAGLFYCLIALIIRFTGTGWLDRVLPPVVIGSVIVVIGLYLAPVAMRMSSNDAQGNYSLVYLSIAAVTLGITIASNIFLKGFFSAIPVLIGLIGGYLFTLIMGIFFPAFAIIDFTVVRDAAWFGLPKFQVPGFKIVPILIFVIVS
jgi:uracil permease